MKLIKPFSFVPKGGFYPVTLQAGEECPKEFEHTALALGAVAAEKKPAPKAKK